MQPDKEIADERQESSQSIKRDINGRVVPPGAQQTPWYKNVSTLISFVALLLSLSTTYFAYTRAEVQNVQNIKTELRGVLQRLSSLPREYEEGMGKNRGDHNVEGAVNFTISQQNSLLSNHAAELARKLPRNNVSATEWYSIAIGFQSDRKYDEAKEFLGYALESSKGLTEKVTVLRGMADLLFKMRKPRDGRDKYEAALDVVSEFGGYDDRTKNEMQIQTHLGWAESESYIGQPDEASKQIAKAKSYWEKLPQDRYTDAITAMVIGAERNVTTKRRPTNAPSIVADNTAKNYPRATPPAPPRTHHYVKHASKKQQPKSRNKRKQVCRGR